MDFEHDYSSKVETKLNDHNKPVKRYPYIIDPESLLKVLGDCHQGNEHIGIEAPSSYERVSSRRSGFLFVHTYPFTLGLNPLIANVVLNFFLK